MGLGLVHIIRDQTENDYSRTVLLCFVCVSLILATNFCDSLLLFVFLCIVIHVFLVLFLVHKARTVACHVVPCKAIGRLHEGLESDREMARCS